MKRVLVTGGGGFLGRAIVQQLIARGVKVRSYSRSYQHPLIGLGVDHFQGDLNAPQLFQALEDCDAVFHVAAKAGYWGDRNEFFAVNHQGTRSVLNACRAAGVARFIHTSTPSVAYSTEDVEGKNETLPYPSQYLAAYPESKAAAERDVLAANDDQLATVALRPHLIWGPGDPHLLPRLVEKAEAGKLKRVGDGRNRVDVTFVVNAAMAHVKAAETLEPGAPHAGKAYFISDGKPVLLWDFIAKLLAARGAPPVRKSVPFRVAYAAGRICEMTYSLIPKLGEPPMTRFVACNLALSHWFDISAAKRDFGYEPVVSTEEGLQRLALTVT